MGRNPGPLTVLPYHISPSPYLCLKCHLPTCLPVWITRKLLVFQSLAKHSFLRESFSNACCIWQTYTSPVLIVYLVSTSSVEIHHIIISCILSCQSYCDSLLPLPWTSLRKRMITCHLSMASTSLCPGSIVYSLAIGWMDGWMDEDEWMGKWLPHYEMVPIVKFKCHNAHEFLQSDSTSFVLS